MLRRPIEQIADQEGVGALCGDARQAGFNDLARVIEEKGRRVATANEHPTIQSVAVIHDAPDAVAEIVGDARQAPGTSDPMKSASI